MTLSKKTALPGFSLIEIMIAVAIMAIMGSLIGPTLMKQLGRGKRAATDNALKVTQGNIKQYNIDTGSYPEKLEDLIKKPENVTGWDGPYGGNEDTGVVELPKDGWGQELQYKKNERGATPPYQLYSQGDPNKEEDRINAK